ncbi:hypothetical protein [Synergistes jonesii]|uniref:hypothetical protein n=1 Tax=Synergistes jonesii TaxID=2754 RepID=UPI001F0A6984|nr:hypothetical protein [Synergistes jonesii]
MTCTNESATLRFLIVPPLTPKRPAPMKESVSKVRLEIAWPPPSKVPRKKVDCFS